METQNTEKFHRTNFRRINDKSHSYSAMVYKGPNKSTIDCILQNCRYVVWYKKSYRGYSRVRDMPGYSRHGLAYRYCVRKGCYNIGIVRRSYPTNQ